MMPGIRRAGQAMTETILLLPFFFMLVFGLLQLGQLGVALLVSNYAASAIARQVVQDQVRSPGLGGAYMNRYNGLLAAGMRRPQLNAVYTQDNGIFWNVTVHACADIRAFPLVGEFLKPVLGQSHASTTCSDSQRRFLTR